MKRSTLPEARIEGGRLLLDLPMTEADALQGVLMHVGGHPAGPRALIDNIRQAMEAARSPEDRGRLRAAWWALIFDGTVHLSLRFPKGGA